MLQHASHSTASHDSSAEIGTGITWETPKAILLKAENLIAHWLYDWCLSFTTFNMTPKSHDLNWKASCKSACQLRRVDKKHGWLSLHKLSRGATGDVSRVGCKKMVKYLSQVVSFQVKASNLSSFWTNPIGYWTEILVESNSNLNKQIICYFEGISRNFMTIVQI